MAEKKEKKIKTAPNSKESEMMVLGSMLTKIHSLNTACDLLDEHDFYYSEHQLLFHVLKSLFKSDKPADVHLVAEELKRIDKLEETGGVAYLTSLAQYAGTAVFVEEYAELVKNKSLLRGMINAAQEIEREALDEPRDVHASLDEAQAKLFAISQKSNARSGILIKDLLTGVQAESGLPYLKDLQARQETFLEKGEKGLTFLGIPTSFTDLDKVIGGLARSNLVIVAGRPGMGKTAFALSIVENVCLKNNVPTGIFSLEMSGEQLVHRMICSQSEVESSKVQRGSLNGSEYQRIVEVVNQMQKRKLIIDDEPGLKVSDLRARARRMKEAHGIELLIIDYLQLLSGSGNYRNAEHRQNEISEISRNLKNLARELNIPVICGSQLSRKVEERQGHRPMMSDLRESGAIEQDADVVMLLLRQEYYDPQNKPGLAQVIVGKNRHGQTGEVELIYRKEFAQFCNYAGESSPEEEEEIKGAFSAFSPRRF